MAKSNSSEIAGKSKSRGFDSDFRLGLTAVIFFSPPNRPGKGPKVQLSFLVVALCAALSVSGCKEEPKPEAAKPIPTRFGVSLAGVRFHDTTVPAGTNFGALLGLHGLDGSTTQKLVEACKGVFDLRKLRSGQPLHLAFDGSGRLRHLVYEPDAIQWVRFDLDSLPKVFLQSRKVDTVHRSVGGTIETSLWDNLIQQGHSPTLIAKVADILAWQVDFFSVQSGDQFRVMYDDYQVDGRSVGQGDIQAVSFTQSGQTSEAFLFRHEGKQGYYDAEGRPTKRLFLKAPLQFSRISSRFSSGRMHPVLRILRPHYGVDYAAPSGAPVMTVGDGTVIARGYDAKGGGNFVKIRHNPSFTTCYMHLKGFASKVRIGSRVQQGDLIGYVGSTGMSTGPHLDFRFFRDGRPVNPLTVQPPPAPPLEAAVLPQFLAHAKTLSVRLDAVATNSRPRGEARRG